MNSKIVVFAAIAVGLIVSLFLGIAVGEGKRLHIALVFGVMIGVPTILSLGKNYWYLIPASLLSGLPAIPFGGRNIDLAELCIALCFGIFITRVAFKLDKFVLFRLTHIPILLFMGWALFVFLLNPIGFAVFGSTTMGARFYLQIGMAAAAFLITSSREITDKDCKCIVIFIILGATISSAYNIATFFLFGTSDEIIVHGSDAGGIYTWHQNLSGPALAVAFLIFSWKSPREILGFKHPLLLFVFLLSLVFTLISGKRTALVGMLLAPLVSAIVFRQYSYLLLGVAASIIFSFLVIFGHGQIFHFPLQIQRTLSWLPAQWDPEFRHLERAGDPFRESLRRYAVENIKSNPIVGKGFAVEYSEISAQLSATRFHLDADSLAAPYAIGRAWHNTWLGYAADFGIPLSVIQGFLYLTVLCVSFKASRSFPLGSLKSIISIYILIYTSRDVLFSHVVGQTAVDAWYRWWMYGLLFSLYSSIPGYKSAMLKVENNVRKTAPKNIGSL